MKASRCHCEQHFMGLLMQQWLKMQRSGPCQILTAFVKADKTSSLLYLIWRRTVINQRIPIKSIISLDSIIGTKYDSFPDNKYFREVWMKKREDVLSKQQFTISSTWQGTLKRYDTNLTRKCKLYQAFFLKHPLQTTKMSIGHSQKLNERRRKPNLKRHRQSKQKEVNRENKMKT